MKAGRDTGDPAPDLISAVPDREAAVLPCESHGRCQQPKNTTVLCNSQGLAGKERDECLSEVGISKNYLNILRLLNRLVRFLSLLRLLLATMKKHFFPSIQHKKIVSFAFPQH